MPADARPRRRRVEPWPVALALALGAMIAASLAFLAVAVAHPDPPVVGDAYAAGLQRDAFERAVRRAEALGFELDLRARPAGGGVAVSVVARGPGGRPVRPRAIALRRERPAQGGHDADVALEPAADAFVGFVPLPLPGRWHLVVTARFAEGALRRVYAVRGPP